MRKIVLSFQKNIRDLGGLTGYNGLKVKENRLFRGGFLGRVDDEDIKIIDSLHLTDIVDFRGSYEFIHRPDYPFKGVTFHTLPTMLEDVKKEKSKTEDSNLLWFLEDETDGFGHMYNLYPELLTAPVAINVLKEFFNLLVSNDDLVVYFHCSQGKDRAGLAAYILEIALGVSKNDARKDYLLSNEAMEIRIAYHFEELKNKPFFTEEYQKSLKEVFSAKEEYLDHALEVVDQKFGSMENYIKNILLVDVVKLRAIYLE